MTYRSFSADLSRFGSTVDKRMTRLIREAAEELLHQVQHGNPVDSGWSRASWILSLNDKGVGTFSYVSGSFVNSNDPKLVPKPTRGAHIPIPSRTKLPMVKWSDRIYLTNNTKYVGVLEDRIGFVAKAMSATRRRLVVIAKEISR